PTTFRSRCGFYRLHERIVGRRTVRRVAERHVDHIDAERDLVLGRKFDGGDDIARRSAAVVIEDAKTDQVCVRGDASELAVGEITASGDEAGDMRAMPVAIER